MEDFSPVPGMLDSVSVEQLFQEQRTNKRRSERVGYYRRPKHWSQPLWIITNQTQPQIRFDLMGMGFEPLPQYGFTPPTVQTADRYGCTPDNSREIWTPILSHQNGPKEFPGEQVMFFRWYRPEGLPGVMRGHRIRFAQFEAMVKGMGGLKEYSCPDCTSVTFFRPSHLARHLHNSHGYDQAAIIALGQASGIDFNEGLMSLVHSMSMWEVPETLEDVEISHIPPPDDSGVVVVEKVVLPNASQMRQAQETVAAVHEDPNQAAMIADLKQQIADLQGVLGTRAVKAVSRGKKPLTEKQAAHMERMREAREQKRMERALEPEPVLA